MNSYQNWITKAKTAATGKKYAVRHTHNEYMVKPESADNTAAECTELKVVDSFSLMVLCKNYQRGKMVGTWRVHKTFCDKDAALSCFAKIKKAP